MSGGEGEGGAVCCLDVMCDVCCGCVVCFVLFVVGVFYAVLYTCLISFMNI